MNPYTDENTTRTFSKDVDEMSLIWHTDKEDRTVTVLEGIGWQFQRDNELPQKLVSNETVIRIKAGEYHRIIKGDGVCVLYIEEK